jgi:flavin reductase (DIM6/NTAB) family NADH-FMN oxidoreductase RutF
VLPVDEDEPVTPYNPGSIDLGMEAYTSRADYALHVVTTTSNEGEQSGCVVGFVTQCSIVPPRFLVCISKVNHTYFTTERSDAVGLHLIGHDQLDVASLFAEESGDVVDKFSRCEWHAGVTGSPVLSECAAWLECKILYRWSVGDHQALLVYPVAGGSGVHQDVMTFRDSPDLEPAHPAEP